MWHDICLIHDNVYLIHDNVVVRRAIRDLLYHRTAHAVIPFAAEADFLDSMEFVPPGCVLAQVVPDRLNDHNLVRTVSEKRNDLPFIALCSSCDVSLVVEIVKSGAVDVFDLGHDDEELLLSVEKAFAILPERIRQADADRMAKERIAILSPKELAVLNHIAHGMLSKQIAHEMGLSVRTVEMHRSHILKRMNLRSMGDCIHLFHLAFRGSVFNDLVA